MKKRLLLLSAVVCCIAVFAGVLAACDNGGGKDGGTGDSVFTESASLEDIVAALENAESLTFTEWYKTVEIDSDGEAYSEEVTYQYKIAGNAFYNSRTVTDNGETYGVVEYMYRANGVDYDISIVYYEDGTETDASKDLDVIDPEYYSDFMDEVVTETFAPLLTTDADGNIVVNDSVIDYISGTAYVKLNGSSIEIGWEAEYSDEYGSERTSHKYTWSGINATTVDIPDEVRALEAEVEWSDSVHYNGVYYRKATGADGSEYYYVEHLSAGAVPEESINTLPVRER